MINVRDPRMPPKEKQQICYWDALYPVLTHKASVETIREQKKKSEQPNRKENNHNKYKKF